jgi:hypothetical protein
MTSDELVERVGAPLRHLGSVHIGKLLRIHEKTGCQCHGADLYWHSGPRGRILLNSYAECYLRFRKGTNDTPMVVLTFDRLPPSMSLTAAVGCHGHPAALDLLTTAVPSSCNDAHRALNAAAATGFDEAVAHLVSCRGASPSALSGFGECNAFGIRSTGVTPLVTAVLEHHPATVCALLKAGAVPCGRALFVACKHNRLGILRALLEAGADASGPSDFVAASINDYHSCHRLATVGLLLQHGARTTSPAGCTDPLARAIFLGDVDVAALLVHHGASVLRAETARRDPQPPLHMVCGRPFAGRMCHLLVKAGAPIDEVFRGHTALDFAVNHVYDVDVDHIKSLVALGAKTTGVCDGWKPVFISSFPFMWEVQRLMAINANTTAFQRVMIGTSVRVMTGLLRDGIATTATTTFADLRRLSENFGTARESYAFARRALGPWTPLTHHLYPDAARASIKLVLAVQSHTEARRDGMLWLPSDMWLLICVFIAEK